MQGVRSLYDKDEIYHVRQLSAQFAPHRVWMSLCSAGQNTNINLVQLPTRPEYRVVDGGGG